MTLESVAAAPLEASALLEEAVQLETEASQRMSTAQILLAAGAVGGDATRILAAGTGQRRTVTAAEKPGLQVQDVLAPVDDAASYLVALRDGVAAPTSWVWPSTQVRVQVGFGDRPGLGGLEVRPGMVWSVQAFDTDDAPIALSGERPVAP
jgi:hypothetical protein